MKTLTLQNALSQATLDAILAAWYGARASYIATGATPSFDMAGTNASPSGVYAEETPPATGKGTIYEMVNDPKTEGFKKWTAVYN